ncbi:Ankyrin repeat domain-containing protein 26, partial [Galemys pyrenaicus]
TALHFAAAHGHKEVVALLIDRECDLNLCDYEKRTALMKAVQYQKDGCVHILLARGANTNISDIGGNNSALHHAAVHVNESVMAELLLHRANLEAKNKYIHMCTFIVKTTHKAQSLGYISKASQGGPENDGTMERPKSVTHISYAPPWKNLSLVPASSPSHSTLRPTLKAQIPALRGRSTNRGPSGVKNPKMVLSLSRARQDPESGCTVLLAKPRSDCPRLPPGKQLLALAFSDRPSKLRSQSAMIAPPPVVPPAQKVPIWHSPGAGLTRILRQDPVPVTQLNPAPSVCSSTGQAAPVVCIFQQTFKAQNSACNGGSTTRSSPGVRNSKMALPRSRASQDPNFGFTGTPVQLFSVCLYQNQTSSSWLWHPLTDSQSSDLHSQGLLHSPRFLQQEKSQDGIPGSRHGKIPPGAALAFQLNFAPLHLPLAAAPGGGVLRPTFTVQASVCMGCCASNSPAAPLHSRSGAFGAPGIALPYFNRVHLEIPTAFCRADVSC